MFTSIYLIRENFVREKYSSLGKYFITFPRRKFSPVIFKSNFFINIFICQSIITIGESLFSIEIGSSSEIVSPSFSLFRFSVSSFRSFHLNHSHLNLPPRQFCRNRFLPHRRYLQLNPLRNRMNRNFPQIPPWHP